MKNAVNVQKHDLTLTLNILKYVIHFLLRAMKR